MATAAVGVGSQRCSPPAPLSILAATHAASPQPHSSQPVPRTCPAVAPGPLFALALTHLSAPHPQAAQNQAPMPSALAPLALRRSPPRGPSASRSCPLAPNPARPLRSPRVSIRSNVLDECVVPLRAS